MLPGLLLPALLLKQPPGTPAQPNPVARIVVTPAAPTLSSGDTLRLHAQAVDASGRPMANARIMWFTGAFGELQGSVDSTGLLHAGYPDRFPVQVVAMVPGAGPSAPQDVLVTVVPGPAARVEIAPRPAKLVGGQQGPLPAPAFSTRSERGSDPVRWSSSAPKVAEIGADGRLTGRAAGSASE